jgi:hypothetical protein
MGLKVGRWASRLAQRRPGGDWHWPTHIRPVDSRAPDSTVISGQLAIQVPWYLYTKNAQKPSYSQGMPKYMCGSRWLRIQQSRTKTNRWRAKTVSDMPRSIAPSDEDDELEACIRRRGVPPLGPVEIHVQGHCVENTSINVLGCPVNPSDTGTIDVRCSPAPIKDTPGTTSVWLIRKTPGPKHRKLPCRLEQDTCQKGRTMLP